MADDTYTPDGEDRPTTSAAPTGDPTRVGGSTSAAGPAAGAASAAGSDRAPGPGDAAGSGDAARSGDTAGSGRARGSGGRRPWVWIALAVAAAVTLLVCVGFGAAAAGVGRLIRHADDAQETVSRTEAACLALERRLNRLVPPGSTGDPGRQAAAIRDENAAVQPFLSEIDQLRGRWHEDDDDRGRESWADGWRALVNARTSYADALDRQVTNGDPAFFIAPQDQRGRPLLDRLERGPHECGGPARRLAAPDL
nr:hypothetical protein [Micromonospora sp. DSM 115978]